MPRFVIATLICALPVVALADESGWGPVTLLSTNSASISVTGGFEGSVIDGGERNVLSIGATGAVGQVVSERPSGGMVVSGDAVSSTNDGALYFESLEITARNSGDVSATGRFRSVAVSGDGRRNTLAVSATGASVSIEARSR